MRNEAHRALSTLDNGLGETHLNTFERYYGPVTKATVNGHDHSTMWIVNPKSFAALDSISTTFLELHPEQLPKRKKRYTYKPQGKDSMKHSRKYGAFSDAMDAILRADPAAVKAEMEGEQHAHAEECCFTN